VNHQDCATIAALGPASAVGALDAEEAVAARGHLRACPLPHPEVGEWLAVAGAIGSALPAVHVPSPDLRARLLRAVRLDP